jgi:hypothetical protein
VSTETNIALGLLAFGILSASGGYAVGRRVHRADDLVLQFRRAANETMGQVAAFHRIARLREKEIAPSTRRFRSHGELPLTAADKAYFQVGAQEARRKLGSLKDAHLQLTKRQRDRLAKLWTEDIAHSAPIVARQSGITKVEHQPGKHHPDKLLPHQGAGGGTPAARTEGKLRDQWKALRKELQDKHGGDLAKWTAEIKNHPLTQQVKQKDSDYWLGQVKNVPQLA